MKLKYFLAAAFIVFAALVLRGVPVYPVLAGVAGAAIITLLKSRPA